MGLISIAESKLWASEYEEPIGVGSSGAVRPKVSTHEELKASFASRKAQTAQRSKLLNKQKSQGELILLTECSKNSRKLAEKAQQDYLNLLEKHRIAG